MALSARDGDLMIPVPASARFPIELEPPAGFAHEDERTWPHVDGRLEWFEGRLLYLPPCGDLQQAVAASVVGTLMSWQRVHPEYVVGANEAGMMLGGDVRGAEAAVWLRSTRGALTGGYVRIPPILAVEVAGQAEGEPELIEKAAWYLRQGVQVVWILLPSVRQVVVATRSGRSRHRLEDRLPAREELPGLEPGVAELFSQLD